MAASFDPALAFANTFAAGEFSPARFAEQLPKPQQYRIEKRQFLFDAGDQVGQIFYLHQGIVRYVSHNADGKEYSQYFTHGPQIIGSTRAMTNGLPATFAIQALSDCLIWGFDWQEVKRLIQQDLTYANRYIELLEYLFSRKEAQEHAIAKLSASERYQQFLKDYGELSGQIEQQHIASYLNITPVALSRIKKQLASV